MTARVLLSVCALAVTATITEGIARVCFPEWAPRTGHATDFWRYDETYGWSNVPNARGRFVSYGFDTIVAHNPDGFRGPAIPARGDTPEPRILVLGDSYVWGFGVNEDEIFTAQMQRFCLGATVINFGVSGYSTDQELLLFRDKGARYGPSVVVLVVATNDYEGNTRPIEYVYYYKPYFVVEGDQLVLLNQPVPRMNFWMRGAADIARRSYVLSQLNRAVEGVRRTLAGRRGGGGAGAASPSRRHAEQLTARLITELSKSVRAIGATLVIVFTDQHGRRGYRLERLLAKMSIHFLYLDDVFDPADRETTHLPADFHWNATGHLLVARTLTSALLSWRMLSPQGCPGFNR